jgi:hypothetical protein
MLASPGLSLARFVPLIPRRTFLQTIVGGAMAWPAAGRAQVAPPPVQYNGVPLGSPWPPRWQYPNDHPVQPPYLAEPPAVIPIDIGRQLLVDDFLVEDTTLARRYHRATYHPASPVLRPDRPWEQRDEVAERTGKQPNPAAMVFSDGVFYDPRDRVFKMWYMGGYSNSTCLATSDDGVTWRKPLLDVVTGTNIVDLRNRDSSTVWLDLFETDHHSRYKMSVWYDQALALLVSPDGIHWTEAGRSGRAGDRSTFFYNPFRRVWVFSLRADRFAAPVTGRYRHYWETPRFASARGWTGGESVAWIGADSRDFSAPGVITSPELYNLDCVAYESVLLGMFSIWRGEPGDREKINEVTVGFSRDGFHWDRPDRGAFLPISDRSGAWNWANVQSAGGCCLIVGDQLYFYVSGRQGRSGTADPGVCTTGLATLRRDGFASMEWMPGQTPVLRRSSDSAEGTLTTRPLSFRGAYLFVNADTRGGELRVEVLDQGGRVIMPFTRDACEPVRGDSTRHAVRWPSTLQTVAGRAVRFRFSLSQGRLFSFWVSPWPSGESQGHPAAGGPEFRGPADTRPA